MKPNRRLALRRENLTELSAEDLVTAAGGATRPVGSCDLPCLTVTRMATVCYICNLTIDGVC